MAIVAITLAFLMGLGIFWGHRWYWQGLKNPYTPASARAKVTKTLISLGLLLVIIGAPRRLGQQRHHGGGAS